VLSVSVHVAVAASSGKTIHFIVNPPAFTGEALTTEQWLGLLQVVTLYFGVGRVVDVACRHDHHDHLGIPLGESAAHHRHDPAIVAATHALHFGLLSAGALHLRADPASHLPGPPTTAAAGSARRGARVHPPRRLQVRFWGGELNINMAGRTTVALPTRGERPLHVAGETRAFSQRTPTSRRQRSG
jgi:hypothetical protein